MPVEAIGAEGDDHIGPDVPESEVDLLAEQGLIHAVEGPVGMLQQDHFVDPEAVGGVVQLRAANRAEADLLRASRASPAGLAERRAQQRDACSFGRTHRQGAAARQRLVVRVREDRRASTGPSRAGPAGIAHPIQRAPLACADDPSIRRS